ncbi:hypothetical protein FNV43_RR09112 [Rhamnella rubrinervis]|uniref:Uncharacterized protein n=1 Tax=Rhamnella rubrinervis TaxID=2594499 RepID=A0A8K0MJG7_9ROSA|nr:hypothetical protein FNV43_RR09112 [Rhamnella rubrinervis]
MDEFSIQITSNLINKLAADAEKSNKKTKRSKNKVPREPQRPQSQTNQKQASIDSETQKGTAATGWPVQPPLFLPVKPPAQSASSELDAIRSVLQESERVVEKLQKQEEKMLQEVTQRAKELSDKEFKLPCQKPAPCSAEWEASLACYKEHVKDSLKCAHFVKTLADCARRVRQHVSSAE